MEANITLAGAIREIKRLKEEKEEIEKMFSLLSIEHIKLILKGLDNDKR